LKIRSDDGQKNRSQLNLIAAQECIFAVPGTDVMIFKIFSPKKSAKKLVFLTQNKAVFKK
jgi:hypothetical protein